MIAGRHGLPTAWLNEQATADFDDVLDALRDRFGDDAIVRGRGLGAKLARQGSSKVE